VRLPVQYLDPQSGSKPAGDKLTYSDGGEDESAEGPSSFDVNDDGSFSISDPLQERIVIFSRQGTFVRDQPLGFAADVIWKNHARRFLDGQWAAGPDPRPPLPQAHIITPNRGFIPVPGGPESEGLAVSWDGSGESLLSIQTLERDPDGTWYVALEVGGQELDTVRKIIRKYSRKGDRLAEVQDVPTDYYVTPVEEFRVRRGIVYQLEPLAGELRINVWDLTK